MNDYLFGKLQAQRIADLHAEAATNRLAATAPRRTVDWRRTLWFSRHYVEMVVAMVVGMVILDGPLRAGAAALGHSPDRATAWTSAMLMTTAMVIGMAAWMWYRRHSIGHVARMTAAMFAPVLVVGGLNAAGMKSDPSESTMAWCHAGMLVLMLAVMLGDRAAYARPVRRRRRVGAILRRGMAVVVALAVPAGIAIAALASQTADAYRPLPSASTSVTAPAIAHSPDKPTAVVVIGSRGAEIADVLGPYETLAASGLMNVYTVSPSSAHVTLTGGLDLVPHLSLSELDQVLGPGRVPEVVVVPAMPDAGEPTNAPVITWLQRMHRAGSLVLGVCNGSRILADAGLLDNRAATSHWTRLGALRELHPTVGWRDGTRWVDDGDIITTGGIISGIDGTLRVVERLFGTAQAARTTQAIGWPDYQPGTPKALPPNKLDHEALIAPLNAGYRWNRPTMGVLLTQGVGELELASVLDPYAGQSFAVDAVTVSLDGPVTTRHGITMVPRALLADAANTIDRLVVPGASTDRGAIDAAATAVNLDPDYIHTGPGFPFDDGLRDLAENVDAPTARWAAKMLEYPAADLAAGSAWPLRLLLGPILISVGTLAILAAATSANRRRKQARG